MNKIDFVASQNRLLEIEVCYGDKTHLLRKIWEHEVKYRNGWTFSIPMNVWVLEQKSFLLIFHAIALCTIQKFNF